MEGKLIKKGEELFELFTQGFLKGSTNHELIDSLNIEEGNVRYKLSLSNCQTIKRGYYLDELAIQIYPDNNLFGQTSWEQKERRKSFKKGFQKALELMGDKKFTEDDMRAAFSYGMDVYAEPNDWEKLKPYQKLNKHIQQTEWDVVIEMEDMYDCGSSMCRNGCQSMDKFGEGCSGHSSVPKLDENGCLILKRKK